MGSTFTRLISARIRYEYLDIFSGNMHEKRWAIRKDVDK